MSKVLDEEVLEDEVSTLEEVRAAAATIDARERESLDLLRRQLTRDNIASMIERYYHRIVGHDNIEIEFDDPDDVDGRTHTIMIADRDYYRPNREIYRESDDKSPEEVKQEYKMETIMALVRSVFPYLESIMGSYVHELGYEIVSRARHCSVNLGMKSDIPEDNINNMDDYIRHVLRRDVEWHIAAHQYETWVERYRLTMWCNLQPYYLRWCVALAPLRMAPYEVLWILDWLPFTVSPHLDAEHRPYDFNRLRKLRLIENVAKAWKRS